MDIPTRTDAAGAPAAPPTDTEVSRRPESLTEATRYLCAAAHLDLGWRGLPGTRLRRRVSEQIVEKPLRAIGVSPGVDLRPVVVQCHVAERRKRARDAVLAFLLVALFVLPPLSDLPGVVALGIVALAFIVVYAEAWMAAYLTVAARMMRDNFDPERESRVSDGRLRVLLDEIGQAGVLGGSNPPPVAPVELRADADDQGSPAQRPDAADSRRARERRAANARARRRAAVRRRAARRLAARRAASRRELAAAVRRSAQRRAQGNHRGPTAPRLRTGRVHSGCRSRQRSRHPRTGSRGARWRARSACGGQAARRAQAGGRPRAGAGRRLRRDRARSAAGGPPPVLGEWCMRAWRARGGRPGGSRERGRPRARARGRRAGRWRRRGRLR